MQDGSERPGEFALIDRYFRPLATASGALGLTDDAAEFATDPDTDLVITADLVASGIHFFPDDPPRSIARKALRVNLSDLAAKGAEPSGYLLTIALPADWTEAWIAEFSAGLAEDQKRYGISLLGGDTSRASGGTTISITAIGRLPKGTMVHRSGAQPGDWIFVSGTVGDGALGLRLRQRAFAGLPMQDADWLIDRYLHPQPRTALAPVIRRFATSALDISDGLIGDLGHICRASGVTAEINAAAVPLSSAARAILALDPTAFATILTGGDDYEILATVAPADAAAFTAAAAEAGVHVSRIGQVRAGDGPPVVLDAAGMPLRLDRVSFDHFG